MYTAYGVTAELSFPSVNACMYVFGVYHYLINHLWHEPQTRVANFWANNLYLTKISNSLNLIVMIQQENKFVRSIVACV